MCEFVKKVRQYQEQEVNRAIEHASLSHTVEVLRNLFRLAAKQGEPVRIVTGCLNASFYNELTDELSQYLASDQAAIEIIVLNPEADLYGNEFAAAVISSGKGKISQVTKGGYLATHPHFLLVGSRAYRYETDHEQTKAVANFNNPDIGSLLNRLFDGLAKRVELGEADSANIVAKPERLLDSTL